MYLVENLTHYHHNIIMTIKYFNQCRFTECPSCSLSLSPVPICSAGITHIRHIAKTLNIPVISKDKFMRAFWLPLELRGLREGSTLGILKRLSEWSGPGEGQELLGRS